jgi:prophage regulatory protein
MARELPDRFKTATMRMAPRTSPASSTAAGVVDAASRLARPDTNDAHPVGPAAPLRFLRFPAVRERTGLSRSTIWRLERRGEFPRHRRISANAVAWVEQEIADWIQSKSAREA